MLFDDIPEATDENYHLLGYTDVADFPDFGLFPLDHLDGDLAGHTEEDATRASSTLLPSGDSSDSSVDLAMGKIVKLEQELDRKIQTLRELLEEVKRYHVQINDWCTKIAAALRNHLGIMVEPPSHAR